MVKLDVILNLRILNALLVWAAYIYHQRGK